MIGSYFDKQSLTCTPLLQWYLKKGIKISNVTLIVEYVPQRCFEDFGDWCSNARRLGDLDENKLTQAETAKLMANSIYGRSITNKTRFRNVTYRNPCDVEDSINSPLFRKAKDLADDVVELELAKDKVIWDLPFQVGFMVYANAKLRMLQFYYDFLMKYFDPSDLQLLETDTDSLYFACSQENYKNAVKPEKREEFKIEKDRWLVRDTCEVHSDRDKGCKDCLYDLRTPGLFKIEFSGNKFVGLCSKTYFCGSDTESDKVRCKGLNARNNKLTLDDFLDVLEYQNAKGGKNISFRTDGKNMYTYEQRRDSLSYFYLKRPVKDDGISTGPCLL